MTPAQRDDRSGVLCWHSTPGNPVKLYECQDPEHTTPLATAGRGGDHFSRETVVYYHGTGRFYVPVTDRDSDMFGGTSEHNVGPCAHQHTTIKAAEKCGIRITDRAVRDWNKAHGL